MTISIHYSGLILSEAAGRASDLAERFSEAAGKPLEAANSGEKKWSCIGFVTLGYIQD